MISALDIGGSKAAGALSQDHKHPLGKSTGTPVKPAKPCTPFWETPQKPLRNKFPRRTLRNFVNSRWVLGRAIHGPMPVSGETFDEFSGPLVHTDFAENKAPSDWYIWMSPEIYMYQWLPNLSNSFGLHRHWPMKCSSLGFNNHALKVDVHAEGVA